jgi:hypothetical protein
MHSELIIAEVSRSVRTQTYKNGTESDVVG